MQSSVKLQFIYKISFLPPITLPPTTTTNEVYSLVQYSRVAGTLSQSSCYYYKPHTTLSTTLYRTNTTPRVFWETDSTFYSSSFLTMQLLILLWLTLRRSNGFLTDDSNHHYSNLLYTSPNHKMDGENFSRKLLML